MVKFGVPHKEVELQTEIKSFTAANLGSSINQYVHWTFWGTFVRSRSGYAPHQVQPVRLRLFKYKGGGNAHWISQNKMAAVVVQWEPCGTNFRQNIAKLRVSCYNGNNDRSAQVLFVQHPREKGEWLHQNLTAATCWLHHSPCPLEFWTNNTLAAQPLSPNIFFTCLSMGCQLRHSDTVVIFCCSTKIEKSIQRHGILVFSVSLPCCWVGLEVIHEQ